MKRSLVLLGVVVLVAAGCGGGGGGTKPSAGTTTPRGKTIKVGLVPDVSGLNDRGFNHLSYVGLLRAQRDFGVQPPVDRFIAGYQAGAKAADPGIKVLNGYSQDFTDQAKCKQVALNQIEQGAGVIFQVAGGCGLGALDAAKEKHVWGIGVDADQSFLGPHILTSATKHVDQAVFLTIKDVIAGKFHGGRNSIYGLKDDGVGLGKISSKVPRSDVAAVAKIRGEIASGKLGGIPTTVS